MSNILETEDISKLLRKFCIPSLTSSLVTSLYNIIDQLFIGNTLGVIGNSATTVVFPVVTIITALSLMCGVGGSASFNIALGKNHQEEAKKSVINCFIAMIFYGLIITSILLLFTKPLLTIFGCTKTIMPYALPYARITSLAFIASIIGAAGPFIIRADGSPMYALLCMIVGTLINIILDAIFILKLNFGIAGAAWATVIGETVSAIMVLYYLTIFRTFQIKLKMFKIDFKMCKKISLLGAGPAINYLTQALVQILLNNSLKIYGQNSIYGSEITLAVAGIANKVNMICIGVCTGLTNGMQPILSFNYGKHNFNRVIDTSKIVIRIILCFDMMVFVSYQLFPAFIISLFTNASYQIYEFGYMFFRIYLMLFFLNGYFTCVMGFFSAIGQPQKSIILSTTRQLFILPLLILILPKIFGLKGILYAGPITDLILALICYKMIHKEYKRCEDE